MQLSLYFIYNKFLSIELFTFALNACLAKTVRNKITSSLSHSQSITSQTPIKKFVQFKRMFKPIRLHYKGSEQIKLGHIVFKCLTAFTTQRHRKLDPKDEDLRFPSTRLLLQALIQSRHKYILSMHIFYHFVLQWPVGFILTSLSIL